MVILGLRLPVIRGDELIVGIVRVVVGVAIATLVYRFAPRVAWPRPLRLRFVAIHLVAAPLAAAMWYAISTPLERLLSPQGSDLVGSQRLQEFLFIGIVVYIMVAVASYAAEGSARAARAEAIAARTQLAALRAQLQPHFLFNALHTVMQLIPVDPLRAAEAAELVGDLLRTTLEEQRDEVTVREEWTFVSRYLELERIRFGDRLVVRAELPDALLGHRVPSFALQTLVENAVIHGAAPRVAPTEIVVAGSTSATALKLSVRNSGGVKREAGTGNREAGTGTGLARLREQLAVLYGSTATLVTRATDDGGFEAVLTVPRTGAEQS
jgi:LytS/YehU family sensor histidine kinase